MIAYKQYCLSRNPFSTERHDYPIVGADRNLNELKYQLSRLVAGGGPHYAIVTGAYGLGKTRILFEIVNRLRANDFEFTGGRKVLVPDRPIRTLPPSPPAAYLSKFLLPEIFRRLGKETLQTLKRELEVLSTQSSEDIASILDRYKVDRNLCQIILALDTELEDLAYRWFLGETLSESERRTLGGVSRIATEDMAGRILVDFLKILAILDYGALVLPLDEFEYVSTQSKSRRTSLIEFFRGIYDLVVDELTIVKNVAGLIMVLATTPDGWDNLTRFTEAEPFIERVRRDNIFIELGPLEEDQVREFIEKRLEHDRLPEATIPDPLFPFDDSSSVLISNFSMGKPRVISSYCFVVIDEGLRQNVERITASFANGVLRDRGFIVEAIPSERL